MENPLGKWLFPNAAPAVRKLQMEVVYAIVAVLVVVCGGLVFALWFFSHHQSP